MSKYRNIPTIDLLTMRKICQCNTDLTFSINNKLSNKLSKKSHNIIEYKPNFNVRRISIQRNQIAKVHRRGPIKHNMCIYRDFASNISLHLSHRTIRTINKYGNLATFLLMIKVKNLTNIGKKLRSEFIKFLYNHPLYKSMQENKVVQDTKTNCAEGLQQASQCASAAN